VEIIDDEYVLKIPTNGGDDLYTLVDLLNEIGIQSLEVPKIQKKSSSATTYIEAFVHPSQIEVLEKNGISFTKEINPSRAIHEAEMEKRDAIMNNERRSVDSRDNTINRYHNYNDLVAFINQIASQYHEIAQRVVIGQSIQGRDIIGIRITDAPSLNEDGEPEFKYIGNMHGDETVGREMLIQLINLLCSNYDQNSADPVKTRITRLIDNTDIYIIPSMNPDGFERSQRANSAYYDLNRNFPDRFPGRQTGSLQPEADAIMNFTSSHNFVLSANFHGGSVVANYPYDGNYYRRSGNYEASPDDDVFRYIASIYSNAHATMHLSTEFTNGITNGADWYVLYGGMQDWNYLNAGCMEITVELSDVKYPNSNFLTGFWNDNKEALLQYMEQVHTGFKGHVTDKRGNALAATITLSGRSDFVVHTDPAHGDYYRIARPGTYTVTVASNGLKSVQRVVNVRSQTPFNAQVENFQLE